MAATSWAFGIGGNWDDGSKWSGGAPPTSADDATIAAAGAYTVTVNSADVAQSLVFDAPNAVLLEGTSGSLDIADSLSLIAGTVELRGSNHYVDMDLRGAVLQLFSGAVLGTTLTLDAGEVSGMATGSVGAFLDMELTSGLTIDAAAGAAVDFGASGWQLLQTAGSPTLQFGSAARMGTVIWHSSRANNQSTSYSVSVAGGTLKAGDSDLSVLLGNDTSTTVAAGARIDLGGFSANIDDLVGAGAIVNTGASGALVLHGGNWGGAISGPTTVEIADDTNFTGANTYALGTTIDSSAQLTLEGLGRINGNLIDNGAFADADGSGVVTLGAISGTGEILQSGAGTLALDQADSYSGGSFIGAGTLAIGNGAALGSGAVQIDDAELLATATLTLAAAITSSDQVTFAAATGKTLTLTGMPVWDASAAPLSIIFGDGASRGTVLVKNEFENVNGVDPIHIRVAGGTAKAGNYSLPALMSASEADTTVAAGATLDLAGFPMTINFLAGAGDVVNSGAPLSLKLEGASFSGVISGAIAVEIAQSAEFFAAETYDRGTTVDSGASLILATAGSVAGNVVDNGSILSLETSGALSLGAISGAGSLTQEGTSTIVLDHADSYSGGSQIFSGKVAIGASGALGSGAVALGGELIATTTLTMSDAISLAGAATLAAATDKTLTVSGAGKMTWDASAAPLTVTFGDSADKGVVLFKTASRAIDLGNAIHVRVADGTLKDGDGTLATFLGDATDVTVLAGATMDAGGSELITPSLRSAGVITNSSSTAATLVTQNAGMVSGVITGNLAVTVDGGTLTLTGANTYTGGTTIFTGSALQLGVGVASGSIAGAVDDGGALVVYENRSVTLTGVISGAGVVIQAGTGATTLSGANTYAGGTRIQRGEVIAAGAASLGSGAVAFIGASGVLELEHSQSYGGTISGFSKTGTTSLDLADIAFSAAKTKASYSGTTTSGELTVTDGVHTAHIKLKGDYIGSTFTPSSDGHGGARIVDPSPAGPQSAGASALHRFIGAAANFGAAGAALMAPGFEAWRAPPPPLAMPRVQIV